jgi:hypothetical protein
VDSSDINDRFYQPKNWGSRRKSQVDEEKEDVYLASPVNSCEDALHKVSAGFATLFLICILMTAVPIHFFDEGFHGGLDALRSGRDCFRDSTKLTNQTQHGIESIGSVSEKLSKKFGGDDAKIAGELSNFSADANFTAVAASDTINSSVDIADRVNTVIMHGQSVLDHYSHTITFTYWAFLGLTMLFFLVSLCPKPLCSCCFKFVSAPVNICHGLCLWSLTGAFVFIGIMASDFCMKPDLHTLQTFQSFAGEGKNTTNSVQFYLACKNSSQEINPDDGKCG